jgi:hypothetical protein
MDRSVTDIQLTVGTLQTQGFLKPLIEVAKFLLAFNQSLPFLKDVIGHQFNED